jgi:hypothetical protein
MYRNWVSSISNLAGYELCAVIKFWERPGLNDFATTSRLALGWVLVSVKGARVQE